MSNKKMACIIDDDPIHVFLTTNEIEKTQQFDEVVTYKNGKVAYDALKAISEGGRSLPDLILLDLNMPIWDGWNFLDEFSSLKIKQRVIIFIFTSSNNPADINKAREYGAIDGFLIKPVSAEELTRELDKLELN